MKRIAIGAKAVMRALVRVLKKPEYSILLVVVAIAICLLVVLLPRIDSLEFIVEQDTLSTAQKTTTVFHLIVGAFTAINLVEVVLALLIGLNIALMVYYFRNYIASQRLSGTGFAGVALGIIGLGCASCGSVVLTAVIGISASSQLVGALPFKGLEFTIASLILLMISIITIALRIDKPAQCAIKKQ